MDHKDFTSTNSPAPPKTPSKETRWWLLDAKKDGGAEVANSIRSVTERLKKAQQARCTQLVVAERLYGNAHLGAAWSSGPQSARASHATRENLKDNVIQSVVDTSTAMLGENKPRPYFLTDGGDYALQRRAKRLNLFVQGIFAEQQAYHWGGLAQRDAGIYGDGLIYVGECYGRLEYERVQPHEVWVDENEGKYGEPRSLHWERPVDRDKVIALYPEHREKLMQVPKAAATDFGLDSEAPADMIVLRRSWHLRSSPEMVDAQKKPVTDGVYVVCVDGPGGGLVLDSQEWDEDFFPFARWIWAPRTSGWWSQGIAERLQSKQLEVNRLAGTIQRSLQMAGSYKVFLERGSKVVKEHLNNAVGAIVEYTGTPPQYAAPIAIDWHWMDYLLQLKQSMYEQEGVSPLQATGEKPAGLNSGVAQREYRDTVQMRMRTQERYNEAGYLSLARVSVAVARRIAKRDGKYVVRTQVGRAMREVSMTAKDLDASDWRLQCFPTSSLPKDPAGRLQTVQEYIQAGLISTRVGRRLLDYPDIEAVESLAHAQEDLLTQTLDAIVDEGVYAPPEPMDDLQLAKEMVLEYLHRARLHGLEEDRLDLLYLWMAQVDAMLAQAAAEAQSQARAAAMMPGAGPPGAPAAPPMAELAPFAAAA